MEFRTVGRKSVLLPFHDQPSGSSSWCRRSCRELDGRNPHFVWEPWNGDVQVWGNGPRCSMPLRARSMLLRRAEQIVGMPQPNKSMQPRFAGGLCWAYSTFIALQLMITQFGSGRRAAFDVLSLVVIRSE
jgi:hypothetical protein